MQNNILILGAGSWGTALSLHLAYAGHNVTLSSWKKEHNEQMLQNKNNIQYMPSVTLFPENLIVLDNWQINIQDFDNIIIATPSSGYKQTLIKLAKVISPNQGIISATKGLCHDSYKLISQITKTTLPQNNFAVLTGPSFAKEVANKLPTAVLSASENLIFAKQIQKIFSNKTFRCYTTTDVIGAQIGGAVKNVLAIATGMSFGMNFGKNAHAALVTRGLAEMKRLGMKLGAKEETFLGLSCLGDLLLTCSDNQSRNRRFGLYIGQGSSINQAIVKINNVIEGYSTAKAVYFLAQKYKVDMPITHAVYNALYNSYNSIDIVTKLMLRQLKKEQD